MNAILKKYPVPVTGLILGLAAAGNLVQSYGEINRSIFGIISAILFVLMLVKIVKFTDGVKESLQNPVVASVFPTFSMAAMLLSTYLKPLSQSIAFALWTIGVALHAALIIWFSKKFVLNFKIKQVFPSWFIVYVGISVASVTAPAFKMTNIGQLAFWFGFITYIILLPLILYRTVKVKEMPEPTLPTLVIFAAPASLLLAGYMNSFETKSMAIVWLLAVLSIIMYIAAIIMLPRLLKLKFYPSYSAFTFPLIISGIAMKLTNGFLTKSGIPVTWLNYLVKFQEAVAVIITLYVLYRYIRFLTSDNKEQATSN
jgi:exfoliative toxin A/B